MTRSLRRFTVFALLGVLAPAQAFAQSDNDRATARELGLDGETALGAKDWKRAEDDFHRADALFHAPTLSLGLARAQAAQGKFVEAWENYHRVVLENVTSSPGFAKALADATSEIGAIEGRRSRVTVNVTGADAPKVTIDDVPVRVEALGVVRFINPGTHLVKAVADGYLPATQSLTIAEGGTQTVSLALQKDPNATAGAAPLNAPPPVAVVPLSGGVEQPTGSSGSSVNRTLGFVALGVGGVGLIEGIITGVLAIGKHSALENDGCANKICPNSANSDLSSYHTLGALSTTGFIVAGVGLAGGLVLVLTAPKSTPAASPAAGLSVTPYIGLGTAGATGTF
jgi:hypothetical protein